MLLDEYKKLNGQSTPSKKEIEAERMYQEDMDMIVEWIQENGIAEMDDDYSVYSEAVISTKTQKGKKRVKSKAEYEALVKSMAAIAEGRRRKDPLVDKLQKVSRLRKKLIAELNKKYNSIARKSAKEALKSAKKVTSMVRSDSVVKSAATKDSIKTREVKK